VQKNLFQKGNIKLESKNIKLRLVTIEDAEFIYSLRSNLKRSKFLSKIKGTVQDQKEWIKEYKKREDAGKEYYFIIESKNLEKLGTIRIYNFEGDTFERGSWIIKEDSPKTTAIESSLLIYEFGFNILNFNKANIVIRKNNQKVIKFHQRFGLKIKKEDDINVYFECTKDFYLKEKDKYKHFFE